MRKAPVCRDDQMTPSTGLWPRPPSPSYITLHYINVLADYITLQAEKVTLHYITAPQARNFDDYITLQARAGPRPMLRPGHARIQC